MSGRDDVSVIGGRGFLDVFNALNYRLGATASR